MALSSDEIQRRLSDFQPTLDSYKKVKSSSLRHLRMASVLIPLFIKNEKIYTLLTLRSSNVKHHSGEVAFPGGMEDNEDADEVDTCLREAEEEIGLKRDSVIILGKVSPRITRHDTFVIPVVGMISSDFVPVPNAMEVAKVFSVPLERFLSNEGHNSTEWHTSQGPILIHFFEDMFDGQLYTTWGLSANMAIELAVAVFRRETEFVYQTKNNITLQNPFYNQEMYLKKITSKL